MSVLRAICGAGSCAPLSGDLSKNWVNANYTGGTVTQAMAVELKPQP